MPETYQRVGMFKCHKYSLTPDEPKALKSWFKVDEFLDISCFAFKGLCKKRNKDPKLVLLSRDFYDLLVPLSLSSLQNCKGIKIDTANRIFYWKNEYIKRERAQEIEDRHDKKARLSKTTATQPPNIFHGETTSGEASEVLAASSQETGLEEYKKQAQPIADGLMGIILPALLSNPNVNPNDRNFDPAKLARDADAIVDECLKIRRNK